MISISLKLHYCEKLGNVGIYIWVVSFYLNLIICTYNYVVHYGVYALRCMCGMHASMHTRTYMYTSRCNLKCIDQLNCVHIGIF